MSENHRSLLACAIAVLAVSPAARGAGIVSLIEPDTAVAGGPSFTIYAGGSGFQSGAVIYWNSTALAPVGSVSPAGATATVAAALIASPGTAAVTVRNPDGSVSNAATFTVRTTHVIPALTSASTSYGYSPATGLILYRGLRVSGTQLEPGVTLGWNGVDLAAGVNFEGITTTIPDSLAFTEGPVTITATNPGGGTSTGLPFNVPSIRTITSVAPNIVAVGSAGFTVTVNGNNFAQGDRIVVLPRTGLLATQFIDSTRLQAAFPGSAAATPETLQVAVSSSAPGGGSGANLYVSNQVPLIIGGGTAPCTCSLSAGGATVGNGASSGSVEVLAPAGCAWSASSSASWLTLAGSTTGTGNGTVTYNVKALDAGLPGRGAIIGIAGQSFTVNQLTGCLFGVTPSAIAVAPDGTSGSIAVGALGANCAWTATSGSPWVLLGGTGSGTGNGVVPYTVQPNQSGTGRTGTVSVGGQTFIVRQAGATCTFSVTPASQAIAASGGTASATVHAPTGCGWTAGSNVPWVTIAAGKSGTGNGTVTFSVMPNPGSTRLAGSLTIAGRTFAIAQASGSSALSCSISAPSAPQVAQEGRAEMLGDLELSCLGFTGSQTADFTLTLNTNVTNTLTAGNTTDAVLLVNEGTPRNGQLAGYGAIRWQGVPLVAGSGGTATVRISKVRADASQLGAGANLQSVPVRGQLTVASTAALPLAAVPVTMAYAAPTLAFQKGSVSKSGGGMWTTIPLEFQETAAAAFRIEGAGRPATRLRIVLSGVPSTVQVFAPVQSSGTPGKSRLYSAEPNGAGGAPIPGTSINGVSYQQLPAGASVVRATWVVTAADNGQLETFTFPLILQNATPSDLNAMQATASLAPVSDIGVASATAPVPRYRDGLTVQKLVNLRVTSSAARSQLTASAHFTAARGATVEAAAGAAGSNVTFVTQVVNDTSDVTETATKVTVRSNLSSGLAVLSCTVSGGGNCTTSPGQVQVDYGSLGPGQSVTVTVVAEVDPDIADGAVLESYTSASSDQLTADLPASMTSSSFIVLNGVPVPIGSQPSSGTGFSGSFDFQLSHPSGWQNLGVINVLINDALDGRHACYVAYVTATRTLILVDDAGNAGGPYAGSLELGSAGVIENSQCKVGLVSAAGSGNTLPLTLSLTFKPGFAGNRIVYVAARDQAGNNSDWQALGVWQVPYQPAGTIGVASVVPARGWSSSGTLQKFTVGLTDSVGGGDFGMINLLVNSALDGRQACYLAYSASANTLYLVDDGGNSGGPFAGSLVLNGSSGSVENGQCAVSGVGSSVSYSPYSLTLALNITFKNGFTGNRVVYVAGRDCREGNNTGWQAMGTWTVQ